MEVVMVEFENSPEDTEGCVATLNELMSTVVSKQPEFHGATVHVEETTGTVINVMRWTKATDFIEFRDSNQDIIGPALGKYGPRGRMLKIALEF